MSSTITTSVVPHFTIADGWIRDFSLEQTAAMTGRAIDSVRIEYNLLTANMDADSSMTPLSDEVIAEWESWSE